MWLDCTSVSIYVAKTMKRRSGTILLIVYRNRLKMFICADIVQTLVQKLTVIAKYNQMPSIL